MNKLYPPIISKAYSGMLFMLILMWLVDLTLAGMHNDFSNLKTDPGFAGLWFIITIGIANVTIQMAISTVDSKIRKWMNFLFAILYTLAMIAHQAAHLMADFKIDYHFFLDLSHHLLGICAINYSYKWLKS